MFTKIKKSIIYIGLILLSVICLGPFLIMMVNSTRSSQEIINSFSLIPGNSLQSNWNIMSDYFNIFSGLKNSLFISVCVTLLSGYFSALTAYGLAIYKFKGRNVVFTTILVLMMVPAQLGLLGFYDLINGLGLMDSYIPLIIPAIASPFTVFFLRQYIVSVLPSSIIEAARMDGASELSIFHRIGLPIMMPGIATMSIGTFIASWNNYLMPLVLLVSPKKFTLPVMMGSLSASKDITANMGATYVSVAVSVVPIMIAFCFFSKYIISSISAGGVKE
ncbi:carbohydrate ABC transporter permease [Clostridium butyricum]|jgi:multiple sugar transport system permease protein|uniref:L-arabinose transport system permease protein AraQ n=1 Tax=Clostridium butyricum TaxID=1492 RepID=A0A512TRF2_CLOBU|nr:carbohydrate ABC transporter permease [Clostridium butyricum]MDB2151667.1 carbohydrate ABC transporter permease [Clostridium butyricum]NOW24286.1 multiple sugar transport system permease protein [Clostridium butyricum]GEQ22671.1 L-arabinose transport system permease protein AraQ [Clostridium butyricum]